MLSALYHTRTGLNNKAPAGDWRFYQNRGPARSMQGDVAGVIEQLLMDADSDEDQPLDRALTGTAAARPAMAQTTSLK